MNDDLSRITLLLEKYAKQIATKSEEQELFTLITNEQNELTVKGVLMDMQDNEIVLEDFDREKWEPVLKKILGKTKHEAAKVLPLTPSRGGQWKKWVAAASIVLALGVGGYLLYQIPRSARNDKNEVVITNDVAPGREGAILTFDNGKQIVLDSAANGRISDAAVKNGNLLSYQNADASNVEYNTMSTPRGRTYSLLLADGSKVWLNAASSIRFPTAFTGNERKVEITGEAYFEVAHDASKPFHVSVNGTDVQVLGTHFNINSYDDEDALKVTLLEGSVAVKSEKSNVKITPGQQAKNVNGELSIMNDVNTEQVMAWKNGVFKFDRADVATVMRQIARWYDVDIEYKGNVDQHFGGTISRDVNASKVFEMLEMTGGVKFKIEGKKVIVMP